MTQSNNHERQTKSNDNVLLELGCGPRKRNPRATGIDLIPYPGVDIVGDALEELQKMPDGHCGEISSHHFLEHVKDWPALINECARVLKAGGAFRAVVPHWSNPYFYSDPTHQATFGLYSFSYLTENAKFRRQVPTYETTVQLEIKCIRLRFKADHKFLISNMLLRPLSFLFNAHPYLQELYEFWFARILPCYELEFELKKPAQIPDDQSNSRLGS